MPQDGWKVLVTGATGFIGSHLVPVLIQGGYDVFGLERYVTGRFVMGQVRSTKTVFGSLTEYHTVRRILRDIQPDVVIHLAAISPVAYSYDHPQEVIETNFLGTVNLAETCLRELPNFKYFLFASTSETYGNGEIPKTENTSQNPNSPYSVSKVASEKYLLYLRDAFDFPVTILRNFNTYGRKDNTHFVVERTIFQMLSGDKVRLGDSSATRDFLYVDDHVSSFIACLRHEKAKGEIFNFCTGREVSIGELVTLIADYAGYKEEIIWNSIPKRPLDIGRLVGANTKASQVLGWNPQVPLEKGLKLTIEYWKSKMAGNGHKTK